LFLLLTFTTFQSLDRLGTSHELHPGYLGAVCGWPHHYDPQIGQEEWLYEGLGTLFGRQFVFLHGSLGYIFTARTGT